MDSRRYIEMSAARYAQIRARLTSAIEPLEEVSLNWRPNENSLSIACLVLCLVQSIHERIDDDFQGGAGLTAEQLTSSWKSKEELLAMIDGAFTRLNHAVLGLTGTGHPPERPGAIEAMQAEILHQCASLFSEQLGQVLYLSRMHMNESFSYSG